MYLCMAYGMAKKESGGRKIWREEEKDMAGRKIRRRENTMIWRESMHGAARARGEKDMAGEV